MNDKIESYKDLVVWKKSHELTVGLFQAKVAKKEYADLVTKLRSVASILPAKIALGFRNRSKKAKLHYYQEAFNAAVELHYLCTLAADLKALKPAVAWEETIESIEHMLLRLIRSNMPTK